MQKGDIFEFEIVSQGMDGEGVAKTDGFVVFIPFTLTGEKVRAEITFVSKSYARAKTIKLLKASPDRAEPPCPLFFRCGGCDLMHIKQELHDGIKRDNIINCFKKTAGIEIECDDLIGGQGLFYRNKAQFAIGLKNGKITAGYYKENSHTLVSVERCPLQGEWAEKAVKSFLAYAEKNALSVYDERTGKGLLRHLALRNVAGHISVAVVINGKTLPVYQSLVARLKKEFSDFSLHISINTKRGNVIMGDSVVTLYGKKSAPTVICGVKAEVSPLSFMQVNDEIRDRLYAAVKEKIAKSGAKTVIDAYSGAGVMTNMLASVCDRVYGIEIVPDAVRDADKTAAMNGNSEKITNICGDAAVELPRLAESLASDGEAKLSDFAVVLDPPRKGCDKAVLDAVLRTSPETVVYVSCNPATLARDCAILKEKYEIKSVTPFDMFPQTKHVETLVFLGIGQRA